MGGEQSTMGLYLRDLGKVPRLSAEEEQACARLAAQGDPQARRRLIQANLRFVVLVAKQYRGRGRRSASIRSGASISSRTRSGGSARRS